MLETYYQELRNYLTGKLKDSEAAADLAQESYLRLLGMQQSGEKIEEPRALLYRIANNLIVDRYRRTAVRENVLVTSNSLSELDVAAPTACEPEAIAMSTEGLDTLLGVINSLPPRCREVFILFKFDGITYAEIGARMGISVRTVEMQLQIAMAACWSCLERIAPERKGNLGSSKGKRRKQTHAP